MTKLITPPGMLLTTAVLAVYAAVAFLIGTKEQSWVLLLGAATSVVACYGAAMVRGWSRYLVYALTLGFVAKLADSIYEAVKIGFFGFQFGSQQEIVRSLLPSLVLTLISLLCCYLVWRQFAPVRGAGAPATAAGAPAATSASSPE